MIPLLNAGGAWILDVIFFALLLLGTLFGVWRGFLKSVCKLAGTIFSLGIAIAFCVPFKNTLQGWFNLEGALCAAIPKVPVLGTWISVAISFVSLIVIVKLLAFLAGFLGKSLVSKCKPLEKIDRFLGGLFGLVCACATIFFLMAICAWIPSNGLHAYIESSGVVGAIFKWDLFQSAVHFSFLH